MFRFSILSAVSAFTVAFAVPAAAQTVPKGSQQLTLFSYDGKTIVPDDTKLSSDLSTPLTWSVGGAAAASALASAPGTPEVTATASTSKYDTAANARAALAYYIFVSGPNNTLSVPILFSGTLGVNAGGSDYGNESSSAYSVMTLQDYSGIPDAFTFVGLVYRKQASAQNRYGSADNGGNYSFTDLATINAGHYLGVILESEVRTQDGGVAFAYADPYFYIDPNFLAAHPGYSLTFSPFVGNDAPNVDAVPEPASWAMLIAGFGLTGGAMRRRSRRTVVLA